MQAPDAASGIATRRMARTGLTITEIGFGGAPIGNFRFNASDDDAQGAMAALWDGGGRYYDTSPFYGYGRSEHIFGQALRAFEREYLRAIFTGDDHRVDFTGANGAQRFLRFGQARAESGRPPRRGGTRGGNAADGCHGSVSPGVSRSSPTNRPAVFDRLPMSRRTGLGNSRTSVGVARICPLRAKIGC